MELQTGLERVQVIRNGETPGQFVKQRIAETAHNLTLAGDVALHVELASEALHKAVALLYERDIDGVLCNVDYITGRILRPMPWGSKGWALWGLREMEGSVLRAILRERSNKQEPRPPLFIYSEAERLWRLDADSYSNLALAQRFLEREPIKLADWRKYHSAKRSDGLERVLRHRSSKAKGQ